METKLDEPSLRAFIDDAHTIVEQRCASHTSDEDALAAVETYVACHLVTAPDPRVQSAAHADIDVEYEDVEGNYWQRAVLTDPTNRIARPGGYTALTT
jgi:hypothetical protein